MKMTVGAIAVLFALSIGLDACRAPVADPPADPPRVIVINPQRGAVERTITLPGDLVGYYESALYSKVTGYLKSIAVDKGDWVKAGEVLAVIEVPELNEQLVRAQASLQIDKLTYERLEGVWKSDPRLVARQDVDIAYSKYLETKAHVEELLAMVSYTRIVAPFDGVITERFVDPGALIRAGGQQNASAPMQGPARPGGPAAPVVSVARLDKLRIYVYVPQGEVGAIRVGTPARVAVQGYGDSVYSGTVVRYSHSLDLSTRTMLTEVDLENPQRRLYPGMYANVTLVLQRTEDALRVPDSALGGENNDSVLLVRDGRLSEVAVTTGINDGRYVEISAGLTAKDLVVRNFSLALQSGERVIPDAIGMGATQIPSAG